ncbi:hypothetical protein, partial [Brucella melitensis]
MADKVFVTALNDPAVAVNEYEVGKEMASKSKAQKLDLEVEKALEQALDIDFGDDIYIDMDLGAFDEGFSIDDLEEQISRAAEELVAEQQAKAAE